MTGFRFKTGKTQKAKAETKKAPFEALFLCSVTTIFRGPHRGIQRHRIEHSSASTSIVTPRALAIVKILITNTTTSIAFNNCVSEISILTQAAKQLSNPSLRNGHALRRISKRVLSTDNRL